MKLSVGVFFGGCSTEHEVSVISAVQAMHALDTEKYQVTPFYTTKQGVLYTGEALLQIENYRNIPALLEQCTQAAILRRSEAYQPTVLAYGDLTLDPGSGNLSCGKDPIRLSGREFQIMELFMRSPRQVFSAERIMERVWGWDNEAEINVVWVNISNLRKKLKSIGSHVTLQANRGLGYVLEESV